MRRRLVWYSGWFYLDTRLPWLWLPARFRRAWAREWVRRYMAGRGDPA